MDSLNFSEMVEIMRKRKGLTQKQFAENIGISQSTYSDIINRGSMTIQTMQKIAAALNCDLKIELIPKE